MLASFCNGGKSNVSWNICTFAHLHIFTSESCGGQMNCKSHNRKLVSNNGCWQRSRRLYRWTIIAYTGRRGKLLTLWEVTCCSPSWWLLLLSSQWAMLSNVFCPSMLFYVNPLSLSGSWVAGAYPSLNWVRGGVRPVQAASSSQSTERQTSIHTLHSEREVT